MAKPNVKELFVNHFEKGIFAIACLIAVISLATTRWAPYGHHPNEITTKIKEADQLIAARTWPKEEQDKFIVPPEESVEVLVDSNIRRQIDSTPFEFDVPFYRDLYGTTKPIEEPELTPVKALIADAGRFLMAVQPEEESLDGSADDPLMADAKTPEKEDDQTAIPAEFQSRESVTSAGASGPPGATQAYDEYSAAAESDPTALMQQYGSGRGASYGYAGSYGEAYGEGGAYGAMGMTPTAEGRGLRFVAVRGIIPLREQVRKFMKAIHVSFPQAANLYEIIDFELERKKMQPGDEPWGGAWEPVNVDIALDILNEALSFDPDVVAGTITDSAVTMPLPGRLMGVWSDKATHPMLENFTLTPEEMEKELAFNRMLLDQYEEQQKNAPEEIVKKRGFDGIVVNTRAMSMDVLDMGYQGAMTQDYDYADDSYGSGAYGDMMAGVGINYAPTSQGQLSTEAKDFLDKLKKSDLGSSKEERDKALMDYIQERVTAQGELLLFRYLDFDVEPGASYRYRARLEIRNPNYGLPVAQVGGLAQIVEGQTRKTDWSNETEPATVPDDVDYFVAKIDEPSSGLTKATMAVFQWNPDYGTTIRDSLEVFLGDEIGGPKNTFVLDPAKNTFEVEPYSFHTGDVLVDALTEDKLPGTELREGGLHADLELPRSAKGSLGISGQVLIAKGNEELEVVDRLSRLGALKTRVEYLNFEQQPYEDIKNKQGQQEQAANDLQSYGAGYSEYMPGMGGGESYGEGGGYAGGYGGAQDYGRGRRGGSGLRKGGSKKPRASGGPPGAS